MRTDSGLGRSAAWAVRIGLLCGLLVLAACGGGGGGGGGGAVTPLPQTLTVTAPATAEPGSAVSLQTSLTTAADLRYQWDFGDGGTSTDAAPSHAWAAAGPYRYTVRVSNASGQSVSASGSVQVGWFLRLNGANCSGAASSGWCWWQTGNAAFATDMQCLGERCVAVGALGQVATSSDGGRSWSPSRVPSGGEDLVHVRMADADVVYAFGVAGRTVWRSADGGRQWMLASQPVTPLMTSPFGGQGQVWVLDRNTLVASNANGWLSRDAGTTWIPLPQVSAVTRNRFLWGPNGASVSPDLGATWRSVPVGSMPNGLSRFVLARLGDDALNLRLLVTEESTPGILPFSRRLLLLSSNDGGLSFTEQVSRLPAPFSSTILVQAALRADGGADTFVRQDSTVTWLRSTNGGLDWSTLELRTGPFGHTRFSSSGDWLIAPVADLTLDPTGRIGRFQLWNLRTGEHRSVDSEAVDLNSTLLDHLGGNLLIRRGGSSLIDATSSDLGRTWALSPTGPQPAAVSIGPTLFFDGQQGLAVTRNGAVARSTDGGRSWQQVVTLFGAARLQRLPDGSVLALGRGSVLRSADRGQTWTPVNLPQQLDSGVAFFDAAHGWVSTLSLGSSGGAVASFSGLQRTLDGGQTWQAVAVPQPVVVQPALGGIRRLNFVSPTNGVLQAGDGSLWWTADGGESWGRASAQDAAGGSRDARSFGALVSDTAGNLLTLGGTAADDVLLRSTDLGRTWRALLLPFSAATDGAAQLKDVASFNGQRIWVAGRGGLLLASSDGGATWRAQNGGTLLDLDAVSALDPYTVWISAANGTLVFTSSTSGD